MRCIIFIVTLLMPFGLHAQNLFQSESIRTIEIFFSQPNWDYLLDSLATAYDGTGTGQGRLVADVVIDGIPLDSCGVRFKGNSTYSPDREKNPLNIDLNWVIPGQEYLGIDKIKLANQWTDPAFMREPLMYELAASYMHTPRANYAKVWINGDYKGLYCNTEHVGNEFLDAHFGTSDGAFFKCDPQNFVLFGDNSNLAYHADSTAYDTLYDMKSDYGLTALQELCYELENNPTQIESLLDVDRVLWFHALSSIYVHLDGYMAFAHNYYMYKDHHGRWSPVLWDLNLSFGGLPFNGLIFWSLATQQLQQLSPYLMINSPDYRPLIARILEQPRYFKMYNAHFKTIKEEQVDTDHYWDRAQYWHSLADTIMVYEPYGQYSYEDFVENLYDDVGAFIGLRPGIRNLMQGRENYLDTLSLLNLPQPNIVNVEVVTNEPASFEPVVFNANVFNADTVMLGYKQGLYDRFVRVQMYDDGLHNDGEAGDDVYGTTITPGAGHLQYYVYADNATGARFSPARAEYEFYELELASPVVLNEIQSNNVSTVTDQDGEYEDWIELYNNSDQPLEMAGYFLSDEAYNLDKWVFPDTLIEPGEFLIVWADEDMEQDGLHASFKISLDGEGVILAASSGSTVDEIFLPILEPDVTFGRYPNGTGPWQILEPTYSAINMLPTAIAEQPLDDSILVYPNPGSGRFTIRASDSGNREIVILNPHGKVILSKSMTGAVNTIDLSAFSNGIYFLLCDGNAVRLVKQ